MGVWFRPCGVSYEEVLRFVRANECVANWVRRFRLAPRGESVWLSAREELSGSRLNKARILCRFFKWLRLEKEVNLAPRELLDLQLEKRQRRSVEDRQWLLNLVLEHSRDNPYFRDYSDGRKYSIFSTIKSFCGYNEAVLTTAKGVFGSRKRRKKRRKQITLTDAKRILGKMSRRDQTICLIMLQSGMEIGAVLNKFSYMWHSQVKPQLDAGCQRMKIEFDERKANGQPYFTYISRDGLHELQKWLAERKRIVETNQVDDQNIIDGEPIFITFRGTPLRRGLFVSKFSRRMGGEVTTHMFRKLFKSEAGVPDRGIDHRIVNFFMGHITDLDDVGGVYDRNPEIREEIFEKEYAKLEPYINIYSGIQPKPLSEEDQVWMRFTNALRKALDTEEKMDRFVKYLEDSMGGDPEGD